MTKFILLSGFLLSLILFGLHHLSPKCLVGMIPILETMLKLHHLLGVGSIYHLSMHKEDHKRMVMTLCLSRLRELK